MIHTMFRISHSPSSPQSPRCPSRPRPSPWSSLWAPARWGSGPWTSTPPPAPRRWCSRLRPHQTGWKLSLMQRDMQFLIYQILDINYRHSSKSSSSSQQFSSCNMIFFSMMKLNKVGGGQGSRVGEFSLFAPRKMAKSLNTGWWWVQHCSQLWH